MGLGILAEALARIEHKIDLLLKEITIPGVTVRQPVHFAGNVCPLCQQLVDYQIDLNHSVVVRRCGCKTGKLPPTIPLFPVTGPIPDGNPLAAPSPEAGGGAPDRTRGKAR